MFFANKRVIFTSEIYPRTILQNSLYYIFMIDNHHHGKKLIFRCTLYNDHTKYPIFLNYRFYQKCFQNNILSTFAVNVNMYPLLYSSQYTKVIDADAYSCIMIIMRDSEYSCLSLWSICAFYWKLMQQKHVTMPFKGCAVIIYFITTFDSYCFPRHKIFRIFFDKFAKTTLKFMKSLVMN